MNELQIDVPKAFSDSFKESLNRALSEKLEEEFSPKVLKKLLKNISYNLIAIYVGEKFGALLLSIITSRMTTTTFIVRWNSKNLELIDPSTTKLEPEKIIFKFDSFPFTEVISGIYFSPAFNHINHYIPRIDVKYPIIIEGFDREVFMHIKIERNDLSDSFSEYLNNYFGNYVKRSESEYWSKGYIGEYRCIKNENDLVLYFLDTRDAHPEFLREILLGIDNLETIKLLVISDMDEVEWDKYDFI